MLQSNEFLNLFFCYHVTRLFGADPVSHSAVQAMYKITDSRPAVFSVLVQDVSIVPTRT